MSCNETVQSGLALMANSAAPKDLTIKCQQQTWKIEKAVAMARLQWFEDKSPLEDVVVLDNLKPETVGHVIEWLYTYHLIDPEFEDTKKNLMAYVRIQGAAVFFHSDDLMTVAENGISAAIAKKAEVVAKEFAPRQPKAEDSEAVREEFEGLLKAAVLARKLNLHRTMEQFLTLASLWKWSLFRNGHFRELAAERAPKYYHELAIRFAEEATNPSWVADIGTLRCQRCTHPLEEQDTAVAYVERSLWVTGDVFFQCVACLAAEPDFQERTLEPVKDWKIKPTSGVQGSSQ
ncbi:hypothetical protein GGR53DRAFT_464542 [Hypoxylon sp. FL1150]|nr:hypothetical protein GGR53DRAFT_464542 [Hypoxylon sp. FL1150]